MRASFSVPNILSVTLLLGIIAILWTASGCDHRESGRYKPVSDSGQSPLKGELIIFHAGSLAVPFRDARAAFQELHPGVEIMLEAGGSVANARKIIDLKRSCDIIAVSDYKVIDEMLIPEYATWNIKFAANEMVIAYTERSAYHQTIDSVNWYQVLLREDVRYARSDPNQDPCGYRTVHALMLAEKYYGVPGLANQLLSRDNEYIRPKEVDLLALLETGTVDYVFNYRSVAQQHQLPYLQLPAEINLKEARLADLYAMVTTEINGKEPGTNMTISGEPMLYSMTILTQAPHPTVAMAFTEFLLSPDGQRIMEACGQPSVVPSATASYDQVPEPLREYVIRE